MSDETAGYLFIIAIIVGLVAFFRFGRMVRERYYAKTADDSYRKRVIGRSFVAATFLGWGGIGTEGFGLPAPILPSLIFGIYHDLTVAPRLRGMFLLNVLAFFVCWCIALIYFAIKERKAAA